MMLAAVRPDDWNLPLLLHVGGAMLLVGALVTVAATYVAAARGDGMAQSPGLSRLAFRTLLFAVIPSFIVMRVTAQWIAAEENVQDSDAAWITIGYASTDLGVLLLLLATVAAGLAARRAARGESGAWARVAPVLVLLLIAIYVVAIWAMTAKPV